MKWPVQQSLLRFHPNARETTFKNPSTLRLVMTGSKTEEFCLTAGNRIQRELFRPNVYSLLIALILGYRTAAAAAVMIFRMVSRDCWKRIIRREHIIFKEGLDCIKNNTHGTVI